MLRTTHKTGTGDAHSSEVSAVEPRGCSAPRSSIHKIDAVLAGEPPSGNRDNAEELLTISWGLIGSVVAAVLPTTREIFEPTVRLMELSREIVKA